MEMAFHNYSSSLNFLLLEVEIIWSERRSEASHRLGIMGLPGHPQEGIILSRTQQGRFLCCCSVWPHWSPLGSLSWLNSDISADPETTDFCCRAPARCVHLTKENNDCNKQTTWETGHKSRKSWFVCVCNDCACNVRWIYVLLDMTKSP